MRTKCHTKQTSARAAHRPTPPYPRRLPPRASTQCAQHGMGQEHGPQPHRRGHTPRDKHTQPRTSAPTGRLSFGRRYSRKSAVVQAGSIVTRTPLPLYTTRTRRSGELLNGTEAAGEGAVAAGDAALAAGGGSASTAAFEAAGAGGSGLAAGGLMGLEAAVLPSVPGTESAGYTAPGAALAAAGAGGASATEAAAGAGAGDEGVQPIDAKRVTSRSCCARVKPPCRCVCVCVCALLSPSNRTLPRDCVCIFSPVLWCRAVVQSGT